MVKDKRKRPLKKIYFCQRKGGDWYIYYCSTMVLLRRLVLCIRLVLLFPHTCLVLFWPSMPYSFFATSFTTTMTKVFCILINFHRIVSTVNIFLWPCLQMSKLIIKYMHWRVILMVTFKNFSRIKIRSQINASIDSDFLEWLMDMYLTITSSNSTHMHPCTFFPIESVKSAYPRKRMLVNLLKEVFFYCDFSTWHFWLHKPLCTSKSNDTHVHVQPGHSKKVITGKSEHGSLDRPSAYKHCRSDDTL